jgi:Zn-dependent protease
MPGPSAELLLILPVLLVSLVLHELAHGLVADALGDPTPRAMGRLTLNPLPHLDLFGTLMLVITALLGACSSAGPSPCLWTRVTSARRSAA